MAWSRSKRRRYQRHYYQNNANHIGKLNREYDRRVIALDRLFLLIRLGGKCCKCEFADERALQFDHIHGGGTKEIRRLSQKQYYKQMVRLSKRELHKKYQLLCANCNWIKRHINHETGGAN